MFPNKEAKNRKKFVIKGIESFIGKLKGIERRFYDLFEGKYTSDLDLNGQNIKISGENFNKTAKILDDIGKEMKRDEMNPLIKWFANSLKDLFDLNWEYFEAVEDDPPPLTIRDLVLDLLLKRIGFTKEGEITPKGWLDDLSSPDEMIRELKREAFQGIWAEQDLRAFRETIQNRIKGNDSAGILTRHLNTITYDSFQQFDRSVGLQMAKRLGYKHAIYQGGLIKTSRDFCIERNNKVFLFKQIQKFGTPLDLFGGYTNKALGKFNGKNKGYDPFTDCGGHNCRHTLDYISEGLAIELLKNKKLQP